MFITSHYFKAEISKVTLMEFLSSAPPDMFCFIIPKDEPFVYGIFLSDELIEYFLNEFIVKSFLNISKEELRQALEATGIGIWGNAEILNL